MEVRPDFDPEQATPGHAEDAKLHSHGRCECQGHQTARGKHNQILYSAGAAAFSLGFLAVLFVTGNSREVPLGEDGNRQTAPVGTERSNAFTGQHGLAGLSINAGGSLWPAFSAEINSYEVELDGASPDEVPWVELEASLLLGNARDALEQPRLRIEGEEFNASAEGIFQQRIHLRSFGPDQRAGHSLPYQLLDLEVLLPAKMGAPAVSRSYAIRFLRPPEFMPRRLEEGPAAHMSPVMWPTKRSAVTVPSEAPVGISLVNGNCARVAGPFQEPPRVSAHAGELGLWRADKEHILCFSDRSGSAEDEVQVVANTADHKANVAAPGKFGFGPGIAVSLRPNIETSAVWPLEAGVQSLGLGLGMGDTFRALALQTTVAGDVSDMPVVVARPPHHRWPVAVQLLDGSLGTCTPSSASDVPRFICRAHKDVTGLEAHFVVFCGTCILSGEGTMEPVRRQQSWTLAVEDGSGKQVHRAPGAGGLFAVPWVGWSATIPEEKGASKQWIVKLQEPSAAAPQSGDSRDHSREGDMTQFEVALVVGGGDISWMQGPERALWVAGILLSVLSFLVFLGAIASLTLSACHFPVPVSAVLPSVSSASLVVQFLALLGSWTRTPLLLQNFCTPFAWAVPALPARVVVWVGTIYLILLILHAGAVLFYLASNGTGSAQALPHSLLFGSWELRGLNFVALPLAAAASSTLAKAQAWYSLEALVSEACLAAMLLAVLAILQCVRSWFSNERVVCVPLPGTGHRVYVDRICDQLRAMPANPGREVMLADWTASPGWSVAPVVSTISDLEHCGSPSVVPGQSQGSWSTLWPPGPWEQDRESVGSTSPRHHAKMEYLRQSSIASAHRGTGVGEVAGFAKDLMSPVVNVHPIKASLQFVFKSNKHRSNSVTGVVGLPWVHAAVLTEQLNSIKPMVASLALQVHAAQLSGPLTSGRLAACFEWADRRPWRWHLDMMIRLSLGGVIGVTPYAMETPWADVWLGGCAGLVALVAAAVLLVQPYAHFIDNIALVAALAAITMAVAMQACGDDLVATGSSAGTVLVALSLVPLIVALGSIALAIVFAIRWLRQDLYEKVLPATVCRWGSASKSARHSKSENGDPKVCGADVQDEYKRVCADPVPENMDSSPYNRTADVLLLSLRGLDSSGKPRVCLPGEWKVPAVYQELVGPSGQEASAPSLCTDRIRVPVPASLLFNPADEGIERAKTRPFAALLTPQAGQLLYLEGSHNGGISWNEAVTFFFQDNRKLVRQAIRLLREHRREVRAMHGEDGLLAVLEFNGTMAKPTNPQMSSRTVR